MHRLGKITGSIAMVVSLLMWLAYSSLAWSTELAKSNSESFLANAEQSPMTVSLVAEGALTMFAGLFGPMQEQSGKLLLSFSENSRLNNQSMPDQYDDVSRSSAVLGNRRLLKHSEEEVVVMQAKISTHDVDKPSGYATTASARLSLCQLLLANARIISLGVICLGMASVVCCMVPHATHTNYRLPPRWEPGLEGSLPFRTWLQDLLLWTITTDLEPHRQAAMIISQLGGAAREMARTLSPQEIFQGGVVQGQQLDPVSFLIHGLSTRFSPLDDEIRIRAAQDLLQFQRRGNEPVDVLLTRFETVRARARTEGGGANLSHESAALVLLRAVGVSPEQFQRLTQPFGMRLPSNEQEFQQLMHSLRRMGHIVEHHPASIATSLRSGNANVSQPSYFAEPEAGGGAGSQSHDSSAWSFVGYPDHQWQHSQASSSNAQVEQDWAYYQVPNAEGASDTDSNTTSDDPNDPIDEGDLVGLSVPEADEMLYWQYAEAKRRWRRYTGKPVRALRRVLRRKGKGKGKTKHAFVDIPAALNQSSFFRSKGKGGKSSGKGFGRKLNARGRDGEVMKCSICGSQYHLRARCNQGQRGQVQSAASGPQASQLPYPPSRPQHNVAGFVHAEVTPGEGQVGPASLHFMSVDMTTNESADVPSTPRQDPSVHEQTAEQHRLTPEDPWMNWHDPWQEFRQISQNNPEVRVPAGAYTGLWPTPPSQGTFLGQNQAQLGAQQNPEHGPSLLPRHESQMLTRVFGTVTTMREEIEEQYEDRNQSQLLPHHMFLQLQGQGGVRASDTSFPMGSDRISGEEDPPQAFSGMFAQVHALRQVSGRGTSQSAAAEAVSAHTHVEPTVYAGDNEQCSICQANFQHQEEVVRVQCRHVFHRECFDEYVARSDENVICPNCRGAGNVVAVWRFIGEEAVQAQSQEMPVATPVVTPRPSPTALLTPRQSPAGSPETVFHTPDTAPSFPWWPVSSKPVSAGVFHASTHRTLSGQLGLLVDPGSFGNLVGDAWAQAARAEMNRSGFQASQKTRSSPLEVGGVGSGTQTCHNEITMQTAVRAADGAMASGTYTAPVIPNSQCPALLGLRSLASNNAVLDMVDNRLILLPTGAQLEVPTGAEIFNLERSQTGHLLLPVTEYDRLKKAQINRQVPHRHMFADPTSESAGTLAEAGSQVASNAQPKVRPTQVGARQSQAKARASAVGSVASFPRPSQEIDDWKIEGKELIRVHHQPRRELYAPTCDAECILPLSQLGEERTTEMNGADGQVRMLTDDWTMTSPNIVLQEEWTGRTRFIIRQFVSDSASSVLSWPSSSPGSRP